MGYDNKGRWIPPSEASAWEDNDSLVNALRLSGELGDQERLEDIFDALIEGLKNHGKVKISNFGTFILRHKKSRIGRNPKTKKEAVISERNVILFKPSKLLKNKINND